jgi:dephospho-CoA kinase
MLSSQGMQKLVIGLVGEKGSGKETFGNLLQELLPDKKILRVRSSDVLVETLKLWDLEKTRENLQNLAIWMDEAFGDGTLSNVVYQRIQSLEADIVIFDGVRWETDVEMLNRFANHLLIYITAPLQNRFERLKKRQEKAFEETTSFEQFLFEENKKNELLIPKIGAKADIKIENATTLEVFKEKIKSIPFDWNKGC